MRLPEQRLYDRLKVALRSRGVRLWRIENVVAEGMPDVIAIAHRRVVFLELKAIDLPPKRPTTPLLGERKGLSKAQKNFLFEWTAGGGESLVVIGIGRSAVVAISGYYGDTVNALTYAAAHEVAAATDLEGVARYCGALR